MMDLENTTSMATPNSTMGPNEMNNTPMALNSTYYIWNKVSHHLEKFENLTREKIEINMGNNE